MPLRFSQQYIVLKINISYFSVRSTDKKVFTKVFSPPFRRKNEGENRYLIKDTMWKLQNFSVIQIIREIKIGQSTVSKVAIFRHLQALNFDFLWNLAFFEGSNSPNEQNSDSEPIKWQKVAISELLNSQKMISRKIWVTQKSWNFYTVA